MFKSVVEIVVEYVLKLWEEVDLVVVVYYGGFEKDLEIGEFMELLIGENEGYDLLEKVFGIDVLVIGY